MWSGEALRWWRHAALARVCLERDQTTPKLGDNVVRSYGPTCRQARLRVRIRHGAATGKGEFPASAGSGPDGPARICALH